MFPTFHARPPGNCHCDAPSPVQDEHERVWWRRAKVMKALGMNFHVEMLVLLEQPDVFYCPFCVKLECLFPGAMRGWAGASWRWGRI